MATLPRRPTARWSLVADRRDSGLAWMLLALTVVTGMVDAVSILSLGRVFVANMTGNVVFIGFAMAHAPGFSLEASLSALAGFLIGAAVAGRLVDRAAHRAALFALGTAIETVLLSAATLVVVIRRDDLGSGWSYLVAGLAALALGLQNGVVRRLAVPDLTTTVLTMTLTGIAADLRSGTVVVRRVLAVVSMLVGAVAGAVLVLHHGPAVGLGCVLALSAGVTGTAVLAWYREARVS
jgi:uncharacterized membrane protein YoaK (UPF0700 family)